MFACPRKSRTSCKSAEDSSNRQANCRRGIVKLTKIGVIDPQDIVVDLLRGPTCWISESA